MKIIYDTLNFIAMIVKISSCLLNIFVLLLLLYGTRNDVAKAYRRTLIWMISIDLAYSICGLIFYPVVYFTEDYFYILYEMLPFFTSLVAKTSVRLPSFTCCFLLMQCVLVLPIPCIVRYLNLTSKSISSNQVDGMFIFSFIITTCYGLFCSCTAKFPSAFYDDILTKSYGFDMHGHFYIVYDPADPSCFTNYLSIAMIILIYILIITLSWKTNRIMSQVSAHLTKETQHMQEQMRRVIIIQTLYPFFIISIPALIQVVYPYMNLRYIPEYLNYYCTTSLMWIAVFNPLSVIFCVPHNRRAVFNMLTCKVMRRPSISNSKDSGIARMFNSKERRLSAWT